MIFRRYELRFVTKDGRVLRGPVFTKKYYERFVKALEDYNDFTLYWMQLGQRRFVIPKGTLQDGHIEIKPVSLLWALIRYWRSY